MFYVVILQAVPLSAVMELERYVINGELVSRHISHGTRSQHGYVDQSPLVARRLGFASLPLAVLAILIGGQIASLVFVIYSDGSSPHHSLWATVTSVTDGTWEVDELVRYAKWAALGLITWAW
jgi:hypothetical protein